MPIVRRCSACGQPMEGSHTPCPANQGGQHKFDRATHEREESARKGGEKNEVKK